jgi:hypothetical protein
MTWIPDRQAAPWRSLAAISGLFRRVIQLLIKGTNTMLKRTLILIAAVMLLVAGSPVTAADEPDATITIDETQVMALIGGNMGGGTLLLDGESHTFKTGGLSLGASIGVHEIHITGNVYHLKKLKHFPGTYLEAEASATVGKGSGGMWLANKHGVTLHLTSSNEGLALSLAAAGLKITMN